MAARFYYIYMFYNIIIPLNYTNVYYVHSIFLTAVYIRQTLFYIIIIMYKCMLYNIPLKRDYYC